MSTLTEQFKNQPVWKLLQNVGPAIDNAISRKGINTDSVEKLARLKSVFKFIESRLNSADPLLTQMSHLKNLSTPINAVITEINAFISNNNPQHITNANNNADGALSIVAQINIPISTDDSTLFRESADSYRLGIEKALLDVSGLSAQIQNELNSLSVRIDELSKGATEQSTRASAIITEFQAQFSKAQDSRSTAFNEAQNNNQDRLTSLLNTYNQKLEDQSQAHIGELEKLKKQFVDESTIIHNEILHRKAEVEKLVGIIGNLGVTSGYLKTAQGAKKTVWLWQTIAVLAMLGFIALAYFAFLPAVNGEFSWMGFAGRVFVSFTVGVLAAYAASQADKYQKIERQNRRLALELEAIGPFIAPLPQTKQEEFRLTIGDRSFGHGDNIYGGSDVKSPATAIDVLASKQLRTLITDIIKATKSS